MEYILHRDGNPLSIRDCLEFILSLPADHILVGFGFGYDCTQILRGIKAHDAASNTKPATG